MPEKRMDQIRIIFELTSLLGRLVWVIVLAVVAGSVGFIAAISIPALGAMGVVKLMGETVKYGWSEIFVLIIVAGILRGVLRYGEQYLNHYLAFKLLALLRGKTFKALRRLCPAKLETKQKGDIISMITSDIETLEVFYAHTLSPVCIAMMVSLTIAGFIAFRINPLLGLYSFIAFCVVGIVLPYQGNRLLKEPGNRYREEFSSFNSYFMDSIQGAKEIIYHRGEVSRQKEIYSRTERLICCSKDLKAKTAFIRSLTEFYLTLLNLGMVIVVLFLVNQGKSSFPLSAASMIILMSSYGPLLALSALPGDLTHTFASGRRLLDLFAEKPQVFDVEKGEKIEFKELQVKDLVFSYSGGNVLNGLNLNVKRGEIIGIMGPSGCGKSTLLKLLMWFWEKESGQILYNGQDIKGINTSSLRKNVVFVSQDTWIFDDTIKNNLLIAKRGARDEDIREAARKASLDDFITSLEDGYDTKVGNRGCRLSSGERQRIALARAFLSGAPLILLDEPTSNIDSINEGIILKALMKYREGRAVLMVSHRASSLSIADRIYNIKEGRLYG